MSPSFSFCSSSLSWLWFTLRVKGREWNETETCTETCTTTRNTKVYCLSFNTKRNSLSHRLKTHEVTKEMTRGVILQCFSLCFVSCSSLLFEVSMRMLSREKTANVSSFVTENICNSIDLHLPWNRLQGFLPLLFLSSTFTIVILIISITRSYPYYYSVKGVTEREE